MSAQIDPMLLIALHGGAERLNIFAKFKPRETSRTANDSAKQLIRRVARKTQEESPQFNFRDLDSVLHVNANRRFIKELIRQPEIESASMVPDLGSAMIDPVNPHDVSEKTISTPIYPQRHVTRRR